MRHSFGPFSGDARVARRTQASQCNDSCKVQLAVGPIYDIFRSLACVNAFYQAYVLDLIDERSGIDETDESFELDCYLMDFAASKLDIPPDLAPRLNRFKPSIESRVTLLISAVKERAVKFNRPLKAELMDPVTHSADALEY